MNDFNLSDEKHRLALERLANSKEFRVLEHQISENNTKFSQLPEHVRLTAIYLLNLDQLDLIDGLWQYFYTRRIPPINEFLTEEWIGATARLLYPQWRRDLTTAFDPRNSIYELVVSGAIGTGKTTMARIGHVYNLLRVTSLRHPQLALGATPDTLLVLALFSVTLTKTSLAVVNPFMSLLSQCPAFQEVKKKSDFLDFKGSEITPYVNNGMYIDLPNDVMVYGGSTVSHSISFSMIGALFDEAEFRIRGVDDALNTYKSLKERVRSRFLGSRFVFLTLVSSESSSVGAIAQYTKALKKDDPYTMYLSYPIWEVKQFNAYASGYFYVLRGSTAHPSKILDDTDFEMYEQGTYHVPPNCDVIKVPSVYRSDFETRIEEALRNLAGVRTLGSDMLFDDTSNVEQKFLCPESHLIAPLRGADTRRLIDQLPASLFMQIPGGRRLARYPSAIRYLHLDLAEVAEAGISMGHKELHPYLNTTMYVTDFVSYVTSPNRISFEMILQLILDLAYEIEVPFFTISADQFQSTSIRQKLESENISKKIEYVSVDRSTDPYLQLSHLVASQTYVVGKAPKFMDQLSGIQIDGGGKISTNKRKDMSDAVCGWVYSAIKNPRDVPTYHYKPQTTGNSNTIDSNEWEEI